MKNKNKAYGELNLIFPTKEYKEQMEEYLQEHIINNELEISGDGGLDRIKDFDKWLQKVEDDVSEKNIEKGRVPSTLFLGVRKSDNKVVGTIQIRHKLTEGLLKSGGHIGDGVRPSERKKGYATEMIRLALEECKKIGIARVLMVCYKDNVASRKSIQNNGGILENEIETENGKIDQRFWISLKKRYANNINSNIIKAEQKLKTVNDKEFSGDVYFQKLIKLKEKVVLDNGVCIQDENYKWIRFYDYNSKVCLTTVYDNKNDIVEWYFDIARSMGKDNGIPYEDDLYLDVVLRPNGEVLLLDEDELKEAFEKYEMTKKEFEEAYNTAYDLINRIKGKKNKVKEFTDRYLKLFKFCIKSTVKF